MNDATWAMLDDYEGCGPNQPPPHKFERHRRSAEISGGDREVDVYLYRGPQEGAVFIPDGDYMRYRSAR
jgi:gamma-glutamylcyclotransferase (GGCT)/AIG2-like uncharacterized protein YtfP